jgi:hypothetical protein
MINFTFSYLHDQYAALIDAGYSVMSCRQYVDADKDNLISQKIIVNRVDIDLSVKKADRLRKIYADLNIPATFFLRLHAKEYNPFDFENYKIIKNIISDGHEIGYHSEIMDQAAIWQEDPAVCLRRDIAVMEAMFGTKVDAVASHGGMTGINNLDFWKDRRASEFGLSYEGYETEGAFALFNRSLYVTDSEWTRWKCYVDGQRRENDARSPAEHAADHPALMYLLVHPDTYYDSHIYE